jgi:hypothetical protein
MVKIAGGDIMELNNLLMAILGVISTLVVLPFIIKLLGKWNKEKTAKWLYNYLFAKIFGTKANDLSNLLSAEAIIFLVELIKAEPDSPEIEIIADDIAIKANKIREKILSNERSENV